MAEKPLAGTDATKYSGLGTEYSGLGTEHSGLGLVLILVAAFMVVLDFSIVNVALASIEQEFGFSAAAVQ